MEETSKTYVFNSDAYGNRNGFDAGTVLGMLAGNNGGLGLGGNTIGELIALAIVASIFGWNGGGFGFGGGNVGSAGFLSNQLSDNSLAISFFRLLTVLILMFVLLLIR